MRPAVNNLAEEKRLTLISRDKSAASCNKKTVHKCFSKAQIQRVEIIPLMRPQLVYNGVKGVMFQHIHYSCRLATLTPNHQVAPRTTHTRNHSIEFDTANRSALYTNKS